MTAPGRLYLVGTPIGNLGDLTPRAARVLGEVDVIAAEDTRTARALLSHLGLRTPTVSLFLGNEAERSRELAERVRAGASVALISESGMPVVADPGFPLVRACIAAGVPVEVVPGPSAPIAALVGSGLPAEEFRFIGFLPRTRRKRHARLRALARDPATLLIFESPRRVAASLADLRACLGAARPAALARELTRVHEEFRRGTLADLARSVAERPARGQITLVVQGASAAEAAPDAGDAVRAAPDAGDAVRAAVRAALSAGATPRDLYRMAVRERERGRERG